MPTLHYPMHTIPLTSGNLLSNKHKPTSIRKTDTKGKRERERETATAVLKIRTDTTSIHACANICHCA